MTACKVYDVLLGKLFLTLYLLCDISPWLVVDESIYHHADALLIAVERLVVLKFLVGKHSRQQIIAEFTASQLCCFG